MSAAIIHFSGLHGGNLDAFRAAIAKIDANMARERNAERLMGEVRRYLGIAYEYERSGEIEVADACGAIAGNKLAQSIRVSTP